MAVWGGGVEAVVLVIYCAVEMGVQSCVVEAVVLVVYCVLGMVAQGCVDEAIVSASGCCPDMGIDAHLAEKIVLDCNIGEGALAIDRVFDFLSLMNSFSFVLPAYSA